MGKGRFLLCAAAALALPGAAFAQDAAAPPTGVTQDADGGATYAPGYFTRFAPTDALDMLRQVPGFTIKSADQTRGLGEVTTNVLINGQRLSTKSDDIFTQLGRIPVSRVERIEIVDGAKFNIPGLTGQVANVVTRASGIAGADVGCASTRIAASFWNVAGL